MSMDENIPSLAAGKKKKSGNNKWAAEILNEQCNNILQMEYEPRPPESRLRHSATTAGSGSETRRSVVNSNGGPWATAISDKPRVFSSEPPDCWNQKGFNPLVRHFFYVTKKCCCILLVLNVSNSSVDLRRLIPLLLYFFEFLAFGSYLQFFFL